MINGFFKVVHDDIAFLVDHSNDSSHSDEQQQQKVGIVAMRMFAALGMACSIVIGLRSFSASSAAGAILKLASAIALYTLSHDIFVIGVNSEKGLGEQFIAVGKGLWDDAKDLWNGNKDFNDVPRHPFTEGTFYRPMWDILLSPQE